MLSLLARVRTLAVLTLIAAGVAWLGVHLHAQSGTRLPFVSTFDGGTLSEWTGGFRNTTGSTIVSSGCFSGRCLRSPLVAGTTSDNYGDFYFGDHINTRGSKVEEAWVRVYSKFDAGWIDNKIILLNLTDGVTSARRYQVYIVAQRDRYFVDHSYIDRWVFNHLWQNRGTAVAPRVGQWDKLKMHVRLNTPGQSNGVVRLWVNDQLKLEYTNLNIREGTAFGMNKLILSTYQLEDADQNGTQWHDEVMLSTTDPDGGGTVPAPPTNLRILSN